MAAGGGGVERGREHELVLHIVSLSKRMRKVHRDQEVALNTHKERERER